MGLPDSVGPHALRGPPARCPHERRSQGRPYRHWYHKRLRAPDSVQPGGGLSADHDQEGQLRVDRHRAHLVPTRGHEHPFPAGARCAHLDGMALQGLASGHRPGSARSGHRRVEGADQGLREACAGGR